LRQFSGHPKNRYAPSIGADFGDGVKIEDSSAVVERT
jgi:hypothetical protein